MTHTVSVNCGSFDSLNPRTMCGLSPCARQMRLAVEELIPACFALFRMDQCVRSFGIVSSVCTAMASTF